MVKPATSGYESAPFQPTVDPSSSDFSNEKTAAEQYDAIYGGMYITGSNSSDSGTVYNSYTTPSLDMVFTQAPDLVPTAQLLPAGSSSSSSADLTFSTDVQLADLRSTEQACLNETSALVDAYNSLKTTVTAAVNSTTIFGQNVGSAGIYNPRIVALGGGPTPTYSQYNTEGQNFAASMDSQMEQVLQEAGNAIELLGQFVAMLNVAGQMYAETDATALNAWRPPRFPIR
jgi:hypothetical protein